MGSFEMNYVNKPQQKTKQTKTIMGVYNSKTFYFFKKTHDDETGKK